ncbi:MAG: 3-hydroxy acid dehydrogenase/malonic semialdehyde reductase [Salibacteraceae bacterium]|jgi:3-hydroxy acid dehydrogenase/malonic semialdehyde reductase
MNKTILITGATSGIGKACAEKFATEGYHLILTGRRQNILDEVRTQLAKHTQVTLLCFDVRDRVQTLKALASISHIPIDILINNAGLAVGVTPIDEGNFEDWDRMIDTNVKGLLNVSKCIIPIMKEQKMGHIVNIGSIAGKEVYPNGNIYCASKHAVDAISKGMRMDLVKHHIRVTNIAPGLVETEFSNVRFYGDGEKADQVYVGMDPLTGVDLAEAIWFCTSRPAHVNIADMLILPSAQASATQVLRKN